jgi:hypothetical protein
LHNCLRIFKGTNDGSEPPKKAKCLPQGYQRNIGTKGKNKLSDESPSTPDEYGASSRSPMAKPPGAKKLSIDYLGMAKYALPYKDELQNMLEVEHAKVFAKYDKDYRKTDLIQFRANLKDREAPPIAVPLYRTRPEVKVIIDRQAYKMIADRLVSLSTSPYSAPILVEKKKLGGYKFLTDFRRLNERCNKIV